MQGFAANAEVSGDRAFYEYDHSTPHLLGAIGTLHYLRNASV